MTMSVIVVVPASLMYREFGLCGLDAEQAGQQREGLVLQRQRPIRQQVEGALLVPGEDQFGDLQVQLPDDACDLGLLIEQDAFLARQCGFHELQPGGREFRTALIDAHPFLVLAERVVQDDHVFEADDAFAAGEAHLVDQGRLGMVRVDQLLDVAAAGVEHAQADAGDQEHQPENGGETGSEQGLVDVCGIGVPGRLVL
jgi:hypothetical protein